MEDLVSIIVPVYNAEKYLEKCLDSIVNQTYKILDIILVDDGSTDNSGAICEKYQENDKRVRVIHKKNGGNGDARNTGLKHAKGKWIAWVDNDDMIHARQIELLLTIAEAKNADIVVGGYRAIENTELPEDKIISENTEEKAEVLSDKHLYDDEFIKKRSMILTTPWSKIYKRELYEGIQYPGRSRHDDTWTTWKIYEKAKKVVFIDEPLYYWRNNPDSFSRVFDISHFTGIDAYAEQLEYYYIAGKQRYVEIVFAEYMEMFFWCYNRIRENGMDCSLLQPYLNYMRRHVNYIKLTKSMGFFMWLKYRYLIFYKIPHILK